MALITLTEILNFAIISAVLGFIFAGLYQSRPKTVYDRIHKRKFSFRDFKFALAVVAPAIVLHELAHKFVAMGFGYTASFELFPFGLLVGVVLKIIGSPLLLVAPGYVIIGTEAFSNGFAYRLIAFAGPAVNLILWIGSMFLLKTKIKFTTWQRSALKMSKLLNMLLFFFNMIPFGPFDGAKVFFGPPS
jgi:Zn-dependent protease